MNDKDLICEICNVHYDLLLFLPICMPCGHTMCFPCLKDKYKKQGKIKCKHDEKTFNLKPELYAKNYYIIKLLQNNKISNKTNVDNSNSNNNSNNTLNSFRNSFANRNSNISSISNLDNNIKENNESRNQKILSYRDSNVNPFIINTDSNINSYTNIDIDNFDNLNQNKNSNSNSNSNSNVTSKMNFRFSGNSKII